MEEQIFAQGLCFNKVFGIFVFGAFLGDVLEMIFCKLRCGCWMSRSSFVCGQFSVVWGLALVIATVLFYDFRNTSFLVIYAAGSLLGGAFEYVCSLFTEKLLGTKFWDYKEMPWNIEGRINLLYCQFWGMAAYIWVKGILPWTEACIERIPVRLGEAVCRILVLFFIVNAFVSALAIRRYAERNKGILRQNKLWYWIDMKFGDTFMERRYPLMKVCDERM